MSLSAKLRSQITTSSFVSILVALLIVGCGTFLINSALHESPKPTTAADSSETVPSLIADAERYGLVEYRGSVSTGQSFTQALATAGLPVSVIAEICDRLREVEFDFRCCKPGQTFAVQVDSIRQLKAFSYHRDRVRSYWLLPDASGELVSRIYDVPVNEELVSIEGSVETSVYHSMLALGEKPELIAAYAEVLGYDIDFIFDPRQGDVFRLLVTRRILDNEVIGYGRILAAEYVGSVTGEVRAYWYEDSSGTVKGWYAADGRNVQRAFMRSPLSILRVTSTFGMRTHPISGRWKLHAGTDYGAPTGTPVWSVASGTVSFAGWRGGYGNLIEVSHPGNIKTRYAHLSRILVRSGQAVRQRQTIGRVGSTGYSTAPHLHFEFLVDGRQIPPRKVKNPPLKKIPDQLLADFRAAIDETRRLWKSALPVTPALARIAKETPGPSAQ